MITFNSRDFLRNFETSIIDLYSSNAITKEDQSNISRAIRGCFYELQSSSDIDDAIKAGDSFCEKINNFFLDDSKNKDKANLVMKIFNEEFNASIESSSEESSEEI